MDYYLFEDCYTTRHLMCSGTAAEIKAALNKYCMCFYNQANLVIVGGILNIADPNDYCIIFDYGITSNGLATAYVIGRTMGECILFGEYCEEWTLEESTFEAMLHDTRGVK